jgi:NitT/TauT family transport system ATP-binding protein
MLIDIQSVTKAFGGRDSPTIALDNVSLNVEEGEFVSFVGHSGCGKSTLLRLMSGLDMPTRGRIVFDGKELDGPVPSMGMAFQQPTLLPWRTVLQNVLLPFELAGVTPPDRIQRARDILVMAGLNGFEDHFPDQLSGGMQQRVGICRSLVMNPKVLFLDEPFAALDMLTRDEMAMELKALTQRTSITTLFVTHSIQEAVLLSDRIFVMSPRPGRVVSVFTVDASHPRDGKIEDSEPMMRIVRDIKELIYARGH